MMRNQLHNQKESVKRGGNRAVLVFGAVANHKNRMAAQCCKLKPGTEMPGNTDYMHMSPLCMQSLCIASIAIDG